MKACTPGCVRLLRNDFRLTRKAYDYCFYSKSINKNVVVPIDYSDEADNLSYANYNSQYIPLS